MTGDNPDNLPFDWHAKVQLEMMIGADRVVRINLDGRCVMRVRLEKGADLSIRNDLHEYTQRLREGAMTPSHDIRAKDRP
jgi:hypothetical protein